MTDRRLAIDAWESLFRAQHEVFGDINDDFDDDTLSQAEYDVLLTVTRGTDTTARLRDVTANMLISQPSVSRLVDRMVAHFKKIADNGGKLAGQKVRELITVNGIRIVLEDGTWGLVRASSNKPELVVVVESPTSEANMRAIFGEIDTELAKQPEVGAYNQKIEV